MTSLRIEQVEPTVFFVESGASLQQQVQVTLVNSGDVQPVTLQVQMDDQTISCSLGSVPPGTSVHPIFVPDRRTAGPVSFALWTGDQQQGHHSVEWTPQKHWEVYLVHYSHHDLGYTDLPSSVLREQAEFLDQVIEYCGTTRDWPEESRFRYLVEQAWSLQSFVETRPQAAVDQLVEYIKAGQVEVTALFGNMTLELCGPEELVRLLYPAFAFKRRYGVDIISAEHNDIPGIAWGLASVLAGAGIRYFSPGIPAWYFGRGEDRVHPLWSEEEVLPIDMPGAFWWEGPDGARVLLWNDLHGGEWHPTSYAHALRDLPVALRQLEERGFPYDQVSYTVRGGRRDNAPPSLHIAYLVREWNRRWAYPRLHSATNRLFLERFEQRWGDRLRILRGDLPGTDYSVGAVGTPHETAANRNSHDRMLAAETFATLASRLTSYHYPKRMIDEGYRAMLLFDEHTWGMAHPGGPGQDGNWSEKSNFAYRSAALSHDLAVKATNRLADAITYPEDGVYLTVFNHLNWERSAPVRATWLDWEPASRPMYWAPPAQADEGAVLRSSAAEGRPLIKPPADLLEQPFELIDCATGQPVPYQLACLNDPQAALPWAPERWALGQVDHRQLWDLLFVADGLPSVGYRSYRIAPCAQRPTFSIDATANNHQIENRFFRLALDPSTGAVISFYDKELDQELVDPSGPHAFGLPLARQAASGVASAAQVCQVQLVDHGPICTTLRLKGELLGCPRFTQEYVVYHQTKRVELNARLLRDSTPGLELYYAFPFRVPAPRFRLETSGAVLAPGRDQLPGSNTNYYAAQHWVTANNDQVAVAWAPVDAPMVKLGGLWPTYVSQAHHGVAPQGYGEPFTDPAQWQHGHLYSLWMASNFRTNFTSVRSGELLLRYAFTAHRPDETYRQARTFGWNAANPPQAVWMQGPQRGTLPASHSFCQVDAANVMLLTLKQAEDGNGIILRLVETAGRPTQATVTLPDWTLVRAFATNLVEEDQALLPATAHSVQVELAPYGYATVRLVPKD